VVHVCTGPTCSVDVGIVQRIIPVMYASSKRNAKRSNSSHKRVKLSAEIDFVFCIPE
jgi:hypothetical protein